MPRTRRDADRFSLTFDMADYLTASLTNKRHTTPPTGAQMDHTEAHCHVIDGWDGGTYALPAPTNLSDGDHGQVMLRGHASQTVTWGNYNFAAETPTFSTDPSKMIVISWKRVNGSLVSVFTGDRNWVY